MADAAPTSYGFLDNSSFDQSGKPLNSQATTDLSNLSAAAGLKTPATSYNGYFNTIQPTSPAVTTAAPVQNAVTNLGNNIGNSSGQAVVPPSPIIPNYNPTFDPYNDPDVQKNIDAANLADTTRQQQLAQERADEIARLTQQETEAKSSLDQTQKNETGTTGRNLLYLQQGGQSASAQVYMNSLVTTHANEMNALQAKYDQAISTANAAYNEKDFQLAQDMTKNAKDIRDEAVKRNQSFLDNYDKLQTQSREDSTAAFNQHKAIYDEQVASAKQATDLAQNARDYATKTGITQPFYELGGTVFSTKDGTPINSAEDFTAAGGKPDYSNVFVVKPNTDKQYAGGDLGEFQYLVDQGVYKEGQLQQFLDKKKSDAVAIAKAGRSVTTNITTAQQQFNLTQEQTQHLAAVFDSWKSQNLMDSDGNVSPATYRTAKQAFVTKFGAAAGPAFDSAAAVYVNSGDTQHYQAQYGLNKTVAGNSLAQ